MSGAYKELRDILNEAYDQASVGKGKERHQVNDRPFTRQPICEIGRMVGLGSPAGQAIKKTQEAMRLPPERAVAELLGAINYLAATIILIREQSPTEAKSEPVKEILLIRQEGESMIDFTKRLQTARAEGNILVNDRHDA